MSGIGTQSRMGLSRKVAILLGVSALALGGCGDALWPTTDAPDPQGGRAIATANLASVRQPASGGTAEADGDNPEARQRRPRPGPQARAAGAASRSRPGASRHRRQQRRRRRRLRPRRPPQARRRRHSTGPSSARRSPRCRATWRSCAPASKACRTASISLPSVRRPDSQRYHALVASVAARLRQGTTPGNPILTAQWNEAQAVLEQVAGTLPAMTKISNDAADQAAFGQFLLNSVQATFGLSGAVEEDHLRLQRLEDEVYQNIVLIDRLMNDLAQDINRQTSYVNNERQNLTTLSLAIKNGELYGTSLATRAFTQSNVIARAEAEAQGPAAGRTAAGDHPLRPPERGVPAGAVQRGQPGAGAQARRRVQPGRDQPGARHPARSRSTRPRRGAMPNRSCARWRRWASRPAGSACCRRPARKRPRTRCISTSARERRLDRTAGAVSFPPRPAGERIAILIFTSRLGVLRPAPVLRLCRSISPRHAVAARVFRRR